MSQFFDEIFLKHFEWILAEKLELIEFREFCLDSLLSHTGQSLHELVFVEVAQEELMQV